MEMMIQKTKLKMEHELKLKQLEMSRVESDDGQRAVEEEVGEDGERPVRARASKWEETLAGRTTRFGDTLRHVLPKVPTDVVKSLNILKISSICLIFTVCLLICFRSY